MRRRGEAREEKKEGGEEGGHDAGCGGRHEGGTVVPVRVLKGSLSSPLVDWHGLTTDEIG